MRLLEFITELCKKIGLDRYSDKIVVQRVFFQAVKGSCKYSEKYANLPFPLNVQKLKLF